MHPSALALVWAGLSETFQNRDVLDEPTGTYLRRVSERPARARALARPSIQTCQLLQNSINLLQIILNQHTRSSLKPQVIDNISMAR